MSRKRNPGSRKRNPDDDLNEEIQAHLQMAASDREDRGESAIDAERNARRELGNELLVRETTRDQWAGAAWDLLAQDLKYALRRIRSHKAVSIAAVLALALGIGVNTAMFTLVQKVMYNRLPVSRPGELYRLGEGYNCCFITGYQAPGEFGLFSWDLYKTIRADTPEIRNMAAFAAGTETMGARRAGSSTATGSLRVEYVSANYFDLFGVRPTVGGFFNSTEDSSGAPPRVVLSYNAWRNFFGSDPAIVGSAVLLKGKPFTVAGVAPASFYGETLRADPPDCWIPAASEIAVERANNAFTHKAQLWLYVMGRLADPGARAGLQTKVNEVARRWFNALAGDHLSAKDRQAIDRQFIPLANAPGGIESLSRMYSSGLILLMSLSSLVMLIACANVANLLLARGASLRAQNSLKMALGASRPRMIRQAFADSVILSLVGGFAGLAVAFASTRLIVSLAFRGARYAPLSTYPSLEVLAFAIGISVLTGLLFGIAPAWMDTHADPAEALRGASRTTPPNALRPQRLLVALQAGLSFVLLTGAVLLTESLWRLERQDFGFASDRRIAVTMSPAVKDYTPEHAAAVYSALQQRIARLPGVARAALATYLPMTGGNRATFIWVEGHGGAREESGAWYDKVSPGYFETIGTKLVRGRLIDASDRLSTKVVALVSQTFVRTFLKDRDPIGARFGADGPDHAAAWEIVGVVEDAKYDSTYRPAYPTFFLPLLQPEKNPDGGLSGDSLARGLVIETQAGARGLEPVVRAAIAQTDPNLEVIGFRSYPEQMALRFNKERLLATLTELFGALALALASIGLYGLVALSAGRRTAEIGVRMALGATRSGVTAMIVRSALVQVGLGIAIGLPASLAGAQLIEHQLYGISPRNPGAMATAAGALLVSAIVAALIPARRAASADPVKALRVE